MVSPDLPIVLIDGVKYQLITPESEACLEKAIQSNCEHIFGPDSFYFDIKKKIRSKAGVASIPDGYVIYFTPKPRWAIIEVELASHPLYDHIIPQLSKFNRGIEDISTRRQLVDIFYGIVEKDEVLKAKLKRKIKTGEVYKFISDLVSEKPLIVVAIDQETEELKEALEEIKGNIKVIEFKTFQREGISDDVNAFVFKPLNTKAIIEPASKIESTPQSGPVSEKYSEFWEPIRREGLFKGKPVLIRNDSSITKGIKGITIVLILRDHKCSTIISLSGPDKTDRGDKVTKLFPKSQYEYEVRETPKFVSIEFPVLDKGKKAREHWPEIRENLTKLGTDIYNKIKESDI